VRPVLPPVLRRLWRDRETLQLGRDPGRAVVLAGLDPGARAALALLDGTRDAAQLQAAARAVGCPPERLATLLGLLSDAGVLVDAAQGWPPAAPRTAPAQERARLSAEVGALSLVRGPAAGDVAARRSAARVLVRGAGRVGAGIATLLAGAGVGAVDVEDLQPARPHDTGPGGLALDDVGRARGEAVRERVRVLAPSVDVAAGAAHLVVLSPSDDVPLDDVAGQVVPGTPHLVAEVRDAVGVVGPLVLPGSTACLRCLDLTRSDLDPDWPALAAQLAQPVRTGPAGDTVLCAAVAAQAAGQVLTLLDGGASPATLDGTLELLAQDWRWRRRSWAPHRDCGCVRVAG
jgi:hypothetical protein